ncbi:unnamed protein product [Cunninghamella blakesleeana]
MDSLVDSKMQIIEHHENIVLENTGTTKDIEKVEEFQPEFIEHEVEGKTSWVAWLQVAVVVCITSSSALMWMTATSSPQASVEYLNTSITSVNWLSNVSAIITAIFSLPAGWCYERFGIKISLIIAALTNLIGCWIRCIAIAVPTNQKYAAMMAGQVIASLGGPLGFNIAAKLASVWFAVKDRPIANALISVQLGMLIAPIALPVVASTAADIPKTLYITAAIATAVAIPTPFLPSKPKTPPTKTAFEERMEFFVGCKKLLRNGPFWCGAFYGSLALGAAYTYGVLIMQAIIPYGYSDLEAGICASVMVASGFAGGIIMGYWAGKTGQYIMLIKIFSPFVMFSFISFIFQIIPNAYGSVLLVCIFNGYFTWGIVPVLIEFCSEVAYPVPESVTSCIIFTFGTVFMFIFSVLVDSLRAGPDAAVPDNMTNSLIAMAAIMCGCYLPVFWLKGDMKRLAADGKI